MEVGPLLEKPTPNAASGCKFCAIGTGELPAAKVLDDPDVVAFLDHRPLFHGHVLVVPRRHSDSMFDLPPDDLPNLFGTVQRVAEAVRVAMGVEGVFVGNNNVVSQSVPHLHIHVVPRQKGDGLRGFFWPRHRYISDEEAEAVAMRIRDALGQ